jgi:hypothetical protein
MKQEKTGLIRKAKMRETAQVGRFVTVLRSGARSVDVQSLMQDPDVQNEMKQLREALEA